MHKICIIGTWHLGCVVSASLAEMGNEVRGIDFDRAIVDGLKQGRPPLFEPGLDDLIAKNVRAGRLVYTDDFKQALSGADFIFITFDTPVDEKDRSDLTPIYRAAEEIARHSASTAPYVVISSQIPVGTCRELAAFIRRKNPRLSPVVIYNPENLRLGAAIETFSRPDRIVIGAERREEAAKLEALYEAIAAPKLVMSRESAELVKHALNSYLAASVSFINEIADLCEVFGADARDVVEALKSDGRIGRRAFLNPGLGFAGGTLARDLKVLRELGKSKRIPTAMVEATLAVNRGRIASVLRKIRRAFPKTKGLNGAILGLTYKPGTSTLRRSISLELAGAMRKLGIKVKAYDPMVKPGQGGETLLKGIQICSNVYEAAAGAAVIVFATEWPEFKELDFARLKKAAAGTRPLLIDTKNILDGAALAECGFSYAGTGISTKK